MTFKDIFQDFPGPGIFKKKNPGLSRRCGNPECTDNICRQLTGDNL